MELVVIFGNAFLPLCVAYNCKRFPWLYPAFRYRAFHSHYNDSVVFHSIVLPCNPLQSLAFGDDEVLRGKLPAAYVLHRNHGADLVGVGVNGFAEPLVLQVDALRFAASGAIALRAGAWRGRRCRRGFEVAAIHDEVCLRESRGPASLQDAVEREAAVGIENGFYDDLRCFRHAGLSFLHGERRLGRLQHFDALAFVRPAGNLVVHLRLHWNVFA